WSLDPRDSHTVIAVNRLLAAGCAVDWSPRGYFFARHSETTARVLATAARELGVRAEAVDRETREARARVAAPRLGLFDVYGGHMGTGWDHWLLREFDFPVQIVFGERVEAGDLRRDF